jgi:DNA-directed RNA polymerase specialized sigma24 family protein
MITHRPSLHICDRCSGSEQFRCNVFWSEWQSWLKPYVLSRIYTYNLPVWQGEESEIANDVLQETSIRLLKCLNPQTAAHDRPIESLESFSITVAHHCILDLVRRQRRLVRFTPSTVYENRRMDIPSIEFSEIALDQLICGELLMKLACIIKDFPPMQRRAMLIDLAKYAHFDEEGGQLQAAFLELDINLQEYYRPRPHDPVERNRHASLLSVAYKRLRQTFSTDIGELVA